VSAFRALPVAEWPAADRAAWEKARTPKAKLFSAGGSGAALSPYTLHLYEVRNGIWLRFLSEVGELRANETPDGRVTPERLDLLVAAFELAERKPGTTKIQIAAMHAILTHMTPGANLHFMLQPGGSTLGRVFASTPKPFPLIDTEEVMAKVQVLRAAAAIREGQVKGAVMLRDAALMAVFARRAPRVGAMAALRLRAHVRTAAEGGFRVLLASQIMKCGPSLSWDLDADVAEILRGYLTWAGPLLLRRNGGAEAGDALWLGMDGRPLNRVGVAGVYLRRTGEWFGEPSRPHTARKWLKDSAASRSPESAFDAAVVMGHSPQTSLRHYTAARDRAAGARHVAALRQERRDSVALAQRFFTERGLLRR
jgi:hypothetical protein